MRLDNVITASHIALCADLDGESQAWYLLISDTPGDTAEDICDALKAVEINCQRIEARTPDALLTASHGAKACVVSGSWGWDEPAYKKLDLLRERVRSNWPILIWVTKPEAEQTFVHCAPNMFSFFSPEAGRWSNGDMSDDEVEAHLVALRKQHDLTDEAVVRMAAGGTLPNDADHHAWLVLLGRSDLIPNKNERD